MGLNNLILISPAPFTEETQWLAHASADILEKAEFYDNLSDVIGKIDILLATSNRKRERRPAVSVRNISKSILQKAASYQIGIVFGRENKGLNNSEINLAEELIFIPAFREHPSLNLAQAVMVTCYELYIASFNQNEPIIKEKEFSSIKDKEDLSNHFYRTLDTIKYKPNNYEHTWNRMRNIFRDFLNQAKIDQKHIRFLHKYFAEIENFVEFRIKEDEEKDSL